MTANTPDEMREQASWLDGYADGIEETFENGEQADINSHRSASAALRSAADQIEAVAAVVKRYAGWYEGGPEDSWRFERDLRTALGMEQYGGDDDD